jgi:hypothetical protein
MVFVELREIIFYVFALFSLKAAVTWASTCKEAISRSKTADTALRLTTPIIAAKSARGEPNASSGHLSTAGRRVDFAEQIKHF